MTIDPRPHRIVAAQPYPLLFATISGAHLYGLPSPDCAPNAATSQWPKLRRALRASWSDYDLRGAHVLPLDAIVGLEVRDETVENSRVGDRLGSALVKP